MTKATKGELAQKPVAELIREIGEASASGALRLSRDRAKAVVYFESGDVAFAASNIRTHRLLEFLKRTGILDESAAASFPPKATDDEVLNILVESRRIRADRVGTIRAGHVAEVLRGVLLWTEGDWEFDPRVRIAGDTRVAIDVRRLLLESTRHLPATYLLSRFADTSERLELAQANGQQPSLLPAEAFVLSRIDGPTTVNDLLSVSGMNAEETLQSLYALAICGVVKRAAWATPQFEGSAGAKVPVKSEAGADEQLGTLEDFFARAEVAATYYDLLGVSHQASADEIKNAYHSLARRFHPDRFHQADAKLRSQIEAAFARVAQAYDVLGDQSSRATYDAQFAVPASPSGSKGATSEGGPASPQTTTESRAESSFQKGVAATNQRQLQQAVRFFAEAASIEPRCARYRAEYGRALISDPKTRRLAEFELKAAIALDPDNTSYRVALAELYKALGLRRRAEGELQRALTVDPKNAAARTLLASLKN
ncbi:MAG TPA: DnaJ domain-containing protein [Pyrinomonadaceae bacterium]|nr:DnaJ domain-containing protein [Pyrinomonadaceae bacterium]